MNNYDVIVVGGGHAGVEAAQIVANMGGKVLLISSSKEAVGGTSCNPAIGGIGKTHIVKEIDVFDGVMPKAADMAAIHYRVLNQKKGKAVQSVRVQIDKEIYRDVVSKTVLSNPNIKFISDMVVDIETNNQQVTSVKTINGKYNSSRVILTTGTFLGGMINIGNHKIPAGRFGDIPSNGLRKFIKKHNFNTGTLKTGTPARLDGNTIAWDKIERQPSEPNIDYVSRRTSETYNKQISCGITFTNKQTHDIINENIKLSSVYSGNIISKGPRYCPSIEDKIYKFPEKEEHQIFVEPEGLNTNSVYPNGISTSLPQKIQDAFLRSIRGFEKVSILRYGYAIEYVNIDPRELYHTLETRKVRGLFFAGQINGTTGYEEAAGQGLVAGLNAILSLDKKEYIFSRSNSYIGVMIDDLVTKGIDEPYRMFTSRSEFRTLIRPDNAFLRLKNIYPEKPSTDKRSYYYLKEILDNLFLTNSLSKKTKWKMPPDGKKRSFYELLSHDEYAQNIKEYINRRFNIFNKDIINTVITDGKYQTYTDRLFKFQQDIKNMQDFNIPQGFNFAEIDGVSNEMKQNLTENKPRSLYEIKNMKTITPAAFMIIYKYLIRACPKTLHDIQH